MDTAGAEEGEGAGTDLEGWLHVTLGREKGNWEQQYPSLPRLWFPTGGTGRFAEVTLLFATALFSLGAVCFSACASN